MRRNPQNKEMTHRPILCSALELVEREFRKIKKAHREDLAVERGKGKRKKAHRDDSSSEMGGCLHR